MTKRLKFIFVLTILTALHSFDRNAMAIEAVASIKASSGPVTIERSTKRLVGRAGLILNDKDVIVTGRRAKATIMFRDGSVIRLFPKTRFIIDKSTESKTGSRHFINNLLLKWGAFWGRFAVGKQNTIVRTPTATAGIKGTVVSFSEHKGNFSASLTSGKISVENDDKSIMLKPGRLIENVSKTGDLNSKIRKIPYKIKIIPEQKRISVPTGQTPEKIFFTLQLMDARTNTNISKEGPVYIHVNHDKVLFPDQVKLNNRGYARISAEIKPFLPKDFGNGKLEVNVIMEGNNFLNVGSGLCLLTYDVPKLQKKTIRIDVKSGILTP